MLQEVEGGTEIAIINPIAMVSGIDNDEMKVIAEQINEKMHRVIDSF
jgi:hypothetical protein